MRIYGLRTCDTCRKAVKSLPDAAFVDVREIPLDRAFLTRALDAVGPALVNTRSTTWRGLDDAARAQDPVALLLEHPALMKRPLVETEGRFYLGWGKDVQTALGVAG